MTLGRTSEKGGSDEQRIRCAGCSVAVPIPCAERVRTGAPISTLMQWFRMYAEFATDPKVQSMDETFQRRFTMFLCLHCSGEFEQLSDDELACSLRITVDELTRTKEVFRAKGFLDSENRIRNWNKRQYKSDDVYSRVKKHRDEKKKRQGNVSVTPSESDTDTESERKKNPDRAAAQPEPSEFVELRRDYPKRAGSQRWHDALGAYRARVREGVDPKLILAGVRRYAAFIRALGKERTEHVQQAATFLGKNRGFELPWTPPAKLETAGDRLLRNLNGGDNSRVIEHEPDTAPPAIESR